MWKRINTNHNRTKHRATLFVILPPNCNMLRRSVVGSLRSLTGNRHASNPSTPTPTPDTLTVPEPARDNRRASVQSASTIKSQREVARFTAALSRRETLIPVDDTTRDTPYYDRSVDLFAAVSPEDIAVDQDEVFEQLVQAYDEYNSEHPLSTLPASVRQRIYSFCFDHSDQRKISLSPKFAIRAVFPDGYFVNPWEVLDPVFGAIHAFQALREDLMNYFWTTYHFHVTLNPFSGPTFSPLSHVWLLQYLDRIQKLSIEADFTRFGGSSLRIAPAFGNNHNKVEDMLLDIIQHLLDRPDRMSMAELHIMSRRYGGFRPYTLELGSATIKYCPEEPIQLCDAMCELRGILQRCRVSGFSLNYSKTMLAAVFADGDQVPEFTIPNDDAWPSIPQPSPPPSIIHTHSSGSSADLSALGLRLHHSRSFAEDFEDEMSRNSFYSRYTAIPEDEALLQEQHLLSERGSLLTESTLTDHDRQNPSLRSSAISNSSTKAPTETPEDTSTPRFQHLNLAELMVIRSVEVTSSSPSESSVQLPAPASRNLQPREISFSQSYDVTSRSRTPTPKKPKIPESPNTLNKLNESDPAFIRTVSAMKTNSQTEANEQDPAFIRTMSAMRSSSGSQSSKPSPKATITAGNRPTSMIVPKPTKIPSPRRTVSSMSTRTNESIGTVKRRYMSFVERLQRSRGGA